MTLRYDKAPSECSSGARPGATALYGYIRERFGLRGLGIYNCRPVNTRLPSRRKSVHADGRALDKAADAFDPLGLAVGDQLASWLVRNAELLGIQYIIWNGRQWGGRRLNWGTPDLKWRRTGLIQLKHRDHLHIELNNEAANTLMGDYSALLVKAEGFVDFQFGPLVLPAITGWLQAPDGGVWLLGIDGGVFAFGNTIKFHGSPVGKPYWGDRQGARLDEPEDGRPGYDLTSTNDQKYGYPE